MTSPLCTVCDEFLRTDLHHIIGARVDAAHFVAESGLVALVLYAGQKEILAIGIGPVVVGVGLLPRLPLGRSHHDQPLVAAMRAHLVGKKVREFDVEDHGLWIVVESENEAPDVNSVFPVRLALDIHSRGSARLFMPSGNTIQWPPDASLNTTHRIVGAQTGSGVSLEDAGIQLLEANDSFVVESFRRGLLDVVRKKRKKIQKRAVAVRQDLTRLDEVPQLQKIGNLLLAQGQTIRRGMTDVTLQDWETNQDIHVKIAPEKSVHEQATEFFQKARRYQRGAQVMRQRLDETERAESSLDMLEKALLAAPADWKAIEEIGQRLHALGFLEKPPASVPTAKRIVPDERKPYHTFRSTNGQTILVGRSGKDNDELVTRVARPHDLWLHAKNTPGAHVVVPLEKNRSCPPQVLVDAATLAAHFSDARNESVCEVSHVERRHVRKPKKSALGTVSTQREKVITVRIEKDRLARLLGSKVET